MTDYCQVALEKLTYAVTDRAELLAMAERKMHECHMHNDGRACAEVTSLTKQLAENHAYIKNLIDDMEYCVKRLPVPVGQVR